MINAIRFKIHLPNFVLILINAHKKSQFNEVKKPWNEVKMDDLYFQGSCNLRSEI